MGDGGSPLPWQVNLAYGLSGIVHSSLLRLQNASHRDALGSSTPQPPVFLLGFWRSGTTLLHEFVCCDPQFGFPSTYACLNPSHFLLSEAWAKGHTLPPTTRPMDNMSYSWASPQEDEFALLSLGAPSPYEALIVPSLLRNPGALVDLGQRPPEQQRRWADTLQFFLRLLTVQQGKAMVLKSPPHGFKLPRLLSLFPDGRYVVIERNPYEVFASNLKLWRTLLDLYALESSSPEEIETFVLEAYVLHEKAISEGKRMASGERLAWVRYEELVADPIGEMKRLYQELKLPNFDGVREAMENHARAAAGYKRNRFVISSAQKARIESCWGSFLKAKHYAWPGEYLRVEN
ncbi:MAG TPA: sulfotransferase [Terriglobales bacterium]|nr:sulfotransferase [Terriglobales bacterium]